MDGWEKYWNEQESITSQSSPYGKWLRRQQLRILKDLLRKVPRYTSILDTGCGSGELLKYLRILGFNNSIGIDYSDEAMKRCEKNGFKIGRDVLQMDARVMTFPNRSFGMVIEEGVWEHFEDCRSFLLEAVRVADDSIYALQPNHFSLMGATLRNAGVLFSPTIRELKEYSYPLSYFIKFLEFYNFKLILKRYTLLKERAWLVFRRERAL